MIKTAIMRRFLLINICLLFISFLKAQQITYEYGYDNAGNRIRRIIIQISKDNGRNSDDESLSPFTDEFGLGESVKIFPNPTTESIRFEISGAHKIGAYVLTDINGKIINKGVCNDSMMTLDLMRQHSGVYLLELHLEEKIQVYKVIKQ